MRVLVTGSEGTLGKVLVAQLRKRGHDVYGCDLRHSPDPKVIRADVAEARQLIAPFRVFQPEVVYHLAAEFGRENGEKYWEQLWKTNCLGTRNVIELCLAQHAKLVFASSSEAYGAVDDYAKDALISEDLLETNAPDFHNEYALTKWTNERQIRTASKNRNLDAVIFRFFNAYGPGEFYTPYRSVVCLFCYRLMFGLPITVYRNYRRVFMWVGDWARTVANMIDPEHETAVSMGFAKEDGVPTFNIGGEEYISVEELKDRIVACLGGTKSEITYLDAEKANVTSKRPDNAMAASFLGHEHTISLDEGIPATVEWMRSVYDENGQPRNSAIEYLESVRA